MLGSTLHLPVPGCINPKHDVFLPSPEQGKYWGITELRTKDSDSFSLPTFSTISYLQLRKENSCACNWLSVYGDAVRDAGRVRERGKCPWITIAIGRDAGQLRPKSEEKKKQVLSTWKEVHFHVWIVLKELLFLNNWYSRALLIALYASCHPIMTILWHKHYSH